jgi:hypothetical protein
MQKRRSRQLNTGDVTYSNGTFSYVVGGGYYEDHSWKGLPQQYSGNKLFCRTGEYQGMGDDDCHTSCRIHPREPTSREEIWQNHARRMRRRRETGR